MSRKMENLIKASSSTFFFSLELNFSIFLCDNLNFSFNNKRLICTKAIFISLSHHQSKLPYSKRNARNKVRSAVIKQKKPYSLSVLKSFGLILRLSCVVSSVSIWLDDPGNTEYDSGLQGADFSHSLFIFAYVCLHSQLFFFLFFS